MAGSADSDFRRTWRILRVVGSEWRLKPGHERSQALLLDRSTLPTDNWKIEAKRTFRTGAGQQELTDEVKRARDGGSITAYRRLGSKANKRSVSCSVIPFASEADAIAYLPKAIDLMIRKPFSKNEILYEGIAADASAQLSKLEPYELQYIGPKGEATERLVRGAQLNYVFILNFWSRGTPWSWDLVESIADGYSKALHAKLAHLAPPGSAT